MLNVLIVFATREGQTQKIARRMAETLRALGHNVELYDADRPPDLDVSRFEAAIVGSPIHAPRGFARSIVRFVREHRDWLDRIPSAFFSVGLAVLSKTSDGRAQTLAIVDDLMKETGWRPHRVELIAGALPYSKYNFLVHGNFDLDQNGVATSQDAEVIQRLITQWGGNIVGEINVDTDFVVLGKEPAIPDRPIDPDPIAQANYERAVAEYDAYQEISAKARTYRIPILNQNRFLYLVGYYEQAKR